MCDVIARPSPAGIAYRRAQLDRDEQRLLAQLEHEELVEVSLPPDDDQPGRPIRLRALERFPTPPRPR